MNQNARTIINETRRQALYLWVGLNLALTLFFVQSQMFFISGNPLPSSRLEWVFAGLGVVTFLMGYLFYRNYTALRRNQILRMPYKDRKQTLLVAFVFQFLLFETLGLYGVLLSVFTKNTWKALPFMLFSYIGFYLAFPREKKIQEFFKESEN